MDNWKINVKERVNQFLTDIYIYRRSPDGRFIIYSFDNSEDTVTEKPVSEGSSNILPTLTIPSNLVPLLLEAVIANGTKHPEKSFIEGELIATKEHLGDLRQLLKLK